MTDYFPSSTTSSSSIVTMSGGDYVYVARNVNLIGTGISDTIYDGSYGAAQIDGALVGGYTVYFYGETGETTTIDISSSATIASYLATTPSRPILGPITSAFPAQSAPHRPVTASGSKAPV